MFAENIREIHMNKRYQVLFDPVSIGPVTAPNRFYQVPHASGMTEANPRVRAAFRGIKAEGGWGVVSTGAVSIHPSSDDSPLPHGRLWDDNDIASHAMSCDAIHAHGALAAVELWHGGASVMNRTSRIAPYSPSGIPWAATHVGFMGNLKPRIMNQQDINDVLRWQYEGAQRARQAGFDILYVYAGMGYLPYEFLLDDYNRRKDGYGGSVANRVRFVRELLEITREAAGDKCAVAIRISLEALRGRRSLNYESEAHEVVSLLSDIPDLWDVKMDASPTDCGSSRFRQEGAHEPTIDFMKQVTDKLVVGVGRFTSPDTMVSQVKRGILDMIGGARASIADPFLPEKIRSGKEDEIRECIGCNLCIASWHDGVPVRCTQNATAGEEWRKSWHPERFKPAHADENVLVVGGGPAGLEAALIAAKRGYQVTLADSRPNLGGRVILESKLPGLSAWRRVVDYRIHALKQMQDVSLYPSSQLMPEDLSEFPDHHLVIATGATWTKSLYSASEVPVGEMTGTSVYTPDDILSGLVPKGPVLIYDFDNYYMGGVLAEALASEGLETIYLTPAGHASAWTIMTNEQPFIHSALHKAGVTVVTQSLLLEHDGEYARISNIFTGDEKALRVCSIVIVGLRLPNDSLFCDLNSSSENLEKAEIKSIERVGDCLAPGAIMHAVYSGHSWARNLGGVSNEDNYLRDLPVSNNPPGLAIRQLND